jgi:protoheme IX farnesyltransferase
MSMTTLIYEDRRPGLLARCADYVELTKPKIAILELVTVAVAAFVAAWGMPNVRLLCGALLGTALVAAGASAWNQWLERHTDARMERTADRPLPAGRMGTREVLWFGSVTTVAGLAYLAFAVHALSAALALATWIVYVCLYTPLKARTPANTAVGAVAGAMPVLIGWTAVGGRLDVAAATLFTIVFLWQFPHFMAIAWIYRQQYAAAGLAMLPVVDPSGRRAARQAVMAALALVPVSLLPAVFSFGGATYFVWVLGLSVGQLAAAAMFLRRTDEPSARLLLRASLVYLPALLSALLVTPFIS